MWERIWQELKNVKHNEIYLTELIRYFGIWINWFNVTIAIFSTGGIMGWAFWDKTPLIACVVTGCISILKLTHPYFLPSEKNMTIYNESSLLYERFALKLESLLRKLHAQTINDEDAMKEFETLKTEMQSVDRKINEICRSTVKSAKKKADKSCDYFFYNVFKLD